VLHETVLLLSIATRGVPEVPDDDALTVENLSQGFHRIVATYGFMQSPNVPEILTRVQAHGISAPRLETSYYLGRERIEVSGPAPLPRWRKRLFSVMARNARTATEFFHLPPDRVVELGAVVEF
jgi:KUP system potassium uptake protein